MNTNDFMYATRNNDKELYRKSKKKPSPVWEKYIPNKCSWEVTNVSLLKECKLINIDQMLEAKYKLDQNSHPENGADYFGRYVYFENSNNLYKVVNSDLECDKYIGNGNWKSKATKITLIGAVNNVVNDNTAKNIIIPKLDLEFNGIPQTKTPKKTASVTITEREYPDLTGKFFMHDGRLFKAVEFNKARNFKDRYRCLVFVESSSLWKHAGFFLPDTIGDTIISEEEAAKFIEKIKDANVVNGLKVKFNVTSAEAEKMKDNMEAAKKDIEDVARKEIEKLKDSTSQDDILKQLGITAGIPFVYSGQLYKVAENPYLDSPGAVNVYMWNDKHGVWVDDHVCGALTVSDNKITENAAIKIIQGSCEKLLKSSVPYEEATEYFEGKSHVNMDSTASPKPNLEAKEADTEEELFKKSISIKVPVTLSEGSMIRANIDGINTRCIINNIIGPEDSNITVEVFRAESIADLFEEIKVVKLSKDRVTQLIQGKLEEVYVSLKYADVENEKAKYVYMPVSQLEKNICADWR
jgi:hypothetical protein